MKIINSKILHFSGAKKYIPPVKIPNIYQFVRKFFRIFYLHPPRCCNSVFEKKKLFNGKYRKYQICPASFFGGAKKNAKVIFNNDNTIQFDDQNVYKMYIENPQIF